ncbi:MAG: CBS domain-containing protein [Polyangiaceae bacterium]|nr:CBS domain-containing protein [Polyangiaceae bacterium]
MTAAPHTIGRDQPLSRASELFRKYHIRHLPVLEGGRLVGLLSDRDVAMVANLKDVDPNQVEVGEAMSQDVFTIEPKTPLDQVVADMARHKYGSALIAQHGKVLGVFTTVDALRALEELLRRERDATGL